MIWRSSHQSLLHASQVIRTTIAATQKLHSLAPPSSSPNIATLLSNLPVNGQRTVTVTASVRTVRNQKNLSFVELGDGSAVQSLQAVLDPSHAQALSTGTSVEITGIWRPAPPQKEQTYELRAENVRVIGSSDAEKYPIQKKYHSAEYLRSLPHLRLRTPLNALLARIRSECDFYLASFFRDRQFVRLQPPIITSSDCEGAGEVFSVSSKSTSSANGDEHGCNVAKDEFFKHPKYLTVSSQLHLEAFVHEHPKVWTLSPTFRAEKSDTPRHVSEFWMLEAEFRTESLQGLMDLVEDMIKELTEKLQNSGIKAELLYATRSGKSGIAESAQSSLTIDHRWNGIMRSSWPRISYHDAMQKLQAAFRTKQVAFQYEPLWSTGLQLEHEKYIAETVGQDSPVFVTDYPHILKPFYMLPSSLEEADDAVGDQTMACFDLLFPEACEVVGGSLREHRLNKLTRCMDSHSFQSPADDDMSTELRSTTASETGNLDWYLDLRRYGSVPHGGFGLGFDRLLGYLTGIGNIKDVVPWPRYHGRCEC